MASFQEARPAKLLTDRLPIRSGAVDKTVDDRPLSAIKLKRLGDLSAEFALCTPAVLFLLGFDRDPLTEFARIRQLTDSNIQVIDSENLIISLPKGVPTHCSVHGQMVDLRRRLYAVPLPLWEDCRAFVCSIVWHSRANNFYAAAGMQQLAVADPTARFDATTNRLDLAVFVARSNQGTFCFEPVPGTTLTYSLCRQPAEPDILQEAAVTLASRG